MSSQNTVIIADLRPVVSAPQSALKAGRQCEKKPSRPARADSLKSLSVALRNFLALDRNSRRDISFKQYAVFADNVTVDGVSYASVISYLNTHTEHAFSNIDAPLEADDAFAQSCLGVHKNVSERNGIDMSHGPAHVTRVYQICRVLMTKAQIPNTPVINWMVTAFALLHDCMDRKVADPALVGHTMEDLRAVGLKYELTFDFADFIKYVVEVLPYSKRANKAPEDRYKLNPDYTGQECKPLEQIAAYFKCTLAQLEEAIGIAMQLVSDGDMLDAVWYPMRIVWLSFYRREFPFAEFLHNIREIALVRIARMDPSQYAYAYSREVFLCAQPALVAWCDTYTPPAYKLDTDPVRVEFTFERKSAERSTGIGCSFRACIIAPAGADLHQFYTPHNHNNQPLHLCNDAGYPDVCGLINKFYCDADGCGSYMPILRQTRQRRTGRAATDTTRCEKCACCAYEQQLNETLGDDCTKPLSLLTIAAEQSTKAPADN
jgi:hypothetical protein